MWLFCGEELLVPLHWFVSRPCPMFFSLSHVLYCYDLWAQAQRHVPGLMKSLSFLVFTAGAVTLGVELSAARLLDPWFGNSQIVWAGLIGLILMYLAIGAWLGGRLADRFPTLGGLVVLASIAGLGVAFVPAISPPVLRLAAIGLNDYLPGLLAGTLLVVLLIFSLPVILLGAVIPWAITLAITDLLPREAGDGNEFVMHPPSEDRVRQTNLSWQKTGRVTGQLYAIGTCGSIIGTFLPVLWLIPSYGTRWSFYLLALWLLTVTLLTALTSSLRQRLRWLPLLALFATLALALLDPGSVRAQWDDVRDGPILYENESLYNYIAVRAWGSEYHLKLNEGVGIHSISHPESLLSQGIWDYFLLAPLFRASGEFTLQDRVLVIGLAAGTVPNLYTDVYGPLEIVGVELDPHIIEVGQQFFGMTQPNLTPVAADGRHWLQNQSEDVLFDIVLVDAYRPPYIPFHLTTVEFFQLVRAHMSERGVLAMNVGRSATNFALVDALASTLAAVFPSVLVVDEPGPPDDLGNSLVVATVQPTNLDTFAANLSALPPSMPNEFRQFAVESWHYIRQADPPAGTPVFSDDHAPIEPLVHSIIWDFLNSRGQ